MPNQAPTYPLFQVIRKGPRPNKTVLFPIGLAQLSIGGVAQTNFQNQPVSAYAGCAFIEATPAARNQDNSATVALATGAKLFAGFVTRDVLTAVNGVPTVPVPTYSELSTGGNPNIPFESSFSAGLEGSLEDADEYEAEGPAFVSSGNGARDITANTTVGTRLSFYGGVTCVAQAGDHSEFELAEIETPSVTGNVRIRARKSYGSYTVGTA